MERRELPNGIRNGAPADNAFLAYLRPTEQNVTSQHSQFFFVKNRLNRRLGAMAALLLPSDYGPGQEASGGN